jgi:hypothetical protein
MPYIVNGVVNVLLLLMNLAGPTPVAGTNGTTAAMLEHRFGQAVAHRR